MQTIPGDTPIIYVLIAILILLTLVAALASLFKGNGLRKEDAENLFREAEEKHREEIAHLKGALSLSRAELTDTLNRTQTDFSAKIRDLESVVANAAKEQGESLTSEMESINNLISSSERNTQEQFSTLQARLENIDSQVSSVGDQITLALTSIAREQRDQKAQNALQVCDALISSLGTLKESISTQIADKEIETAHVVPADNNVTTLDLPEDADFAIAEESDSATDIIDSDDLSGPATEDSKI